MENVEKNGASREIRKGYKQTEVGVIPSDWEVKKLGDFAELTSSKRIFESEYVSTGIPFYRGKEISLLINNAQLEDEYFISESKYEEIKRQFGAPKKGEILITAVGTLGNVYVIPNENKFYFKDGNLIWLKNIRNIIPEYLAIQIGNRKTEIINNSIGSSQKALTIIVLKDTLIPLPPNKAEQTAIAEALSDADALISRLEELIAKKRNIKQGAMQELLTGKKRLPGFSGEWEVRKLGEIADVTKLAGFEYSNYFNSYNDGGDIIVIRGTNITHNKLDLSDIKTIPRETANKLPRSRLKINDLVFAYVGTIGPVYLIEENDKYHLGPNTSKITVSNQIIPEFVFYYFTSWLIKSEITEHTSIGAQPSLSMSKIRRFRIIIPPTKAEQNAIAQILSDMDAEIEQLEQKLDKYRMIKQGMMQELLTGKIRLNCDFE